MGAAGHGSFQLPHLPLQPGITLGLAGVVFPVRAGVAWMLAQAAPEPRDLGLAGR